MIVRTLKGLAGTSHEVIGEGFVSNRFLLASDGMGFTMTESTAEAGFELDVHYTHHLEAVYVLEGRATVTNLETDETYEIGPGTMYAFNKHERHHYKMATDMRMICVFNPALIGDEVHLEDGSYAPANSLK